MAISGVIYKQGKSSNGDIDIWKIVRIGKRVGVSLLAVGVMFLTYIYLPVFVSELQYITHTNKVDEAAILQAHDTAGVQYEAKNLGLDSHYSIYIPKLDVGSNILPNIDPSNEQEYIDALSKGIAHAKGTSFPGMGNNIFLFSHSTDTIFNVERFNAKFYLLNKLENKDKIIVYFSDKKYVYEVVDKKIIDPTDTSPMRATGEELLTLQTCYPPGTSLKRLIVYAKPTT